MLGATETLLSQEDLFHLCVKGRDQETSYKLSCGCTCWQQLVKGIGAVVQGGRRLDVTVWQHSTSSSWQACFQHILARKAAQGREHGFICLWSARLDLVDGIFRDVGRRIYAVPPSAEKEYLFMDLPIYVKKWEMSGCCLCIGYTRLTHG